MNIGYIVFASLGFLAGVVLGIFWQKRKDAQAKNLATQIIEDAKKEAERIKKSQEIEAKEYLLRLKHEFEQKTAKKREEIEELEKRIIKREENLEKRFSFLDEKEKQLVNKENQLQKEEMELKRGKQMLIEMINKEKEILHKITGLSPQEAKELLLKRIEQELKKEKAMLLKQIEEDIRQEADRKAKDILSLAIQRCTVEHTQETTVSVVNLPNDDMKGRIIGREGRNIRTFEMLTGVDLIIDDTPEAVTISSFDPIRREIARLSLERLVQDGRIHPARIEEVVDKTKEELHQQIISEGKSASFEVGVYNLHPELIKLLGRLKFRTSFGQNALQHSKEVAFIMGVLASELGLDGKLAKRIGLLHDIGKSVDHQIEGTHAQIGAELAKKFGEQEIVVEAIRSHHEEVEPRNIYAVLSIIADTVSASRPGARRETLETYLQRIQQLESIVNSFEGVQNCYAIQAGREVRVIVEPTKISDAEALLLARQIKKKIEEEMEYPGQIKITVIRETRSVEYAK